MLSNKCIRFYKSVQYTPLIILITFGHIFLQKVTYGDVQYLSSINLRETKYQSVAINQNINQLLWTKISINYYETKYQSMTMNIYIIHLL